MTRFEKIKIINKSNKYDYKDNFISNNFLYKKRVTRIDFDYYSNINQIYCSIIRHKNKNYLYNKIIKIYL